MKYLQIPIDERNGTPKVTSVMKAELIGEFTFGRQTACSACYINEVKDDCEVCDGELEYTETITVPWDTVKKIYKAMAIAAAAATVHDAGQQINDEPLFYLQDSRSYCGNDVYWWMERGKGYTTDIGKAHLYTKDEAMRQHKARETDIPWPKSYIDQKTRLTVDMQYINRSEALAGTGIVLVKPQQPRKQTYRCNGCGRLMTEKQYYGAVCEHCETENRP